SRSRAEARSRLSATNVPDMSLPLVSRTLYWYVSGMAHPPHSVPVAGLGRDRGSSAAHQTSQLLGVVAPLLGHRIRDLPGLHQMGQGLVHRPHAIAPPCLHGRVDLVDLRLADQ